MTSSQSIGCFCALDNNVAVFVCISELKSCEIVIEPYILTEPRKQVSKFKLLDVNNKQGSP